MGPDLLGGWSHFGGDGKHGAMPLFYKMADYLLGYLPVDRVNMMICTHLGVLNTIRAYHTDSRPPL